MPIPIIVVGVVAGAALLGGGVYVAPKAVDVYQKYQEYEALKEELREMAPKSDAQMDELRARVAELEAEIKELEQAAEVAEEASVRREQEEQKRLIREMLR